MLIDAALLLLVLGILLTFGFAVARLAGAPNGLATAGMTAVFGTAFFLVFANALAYLLAIEWAWRLMLIFMLISAAVVFRFTPKTVADSASIPPRWYVWSTAILSVVIGFMNSRFVGSDPDMWTHFPLAAQIMQGNFPVTEAVNPWHAIGYHYGPAFLAAAFSAVSHVTLVVSYMFQPLLGAVGVLLFAGALARTFTPNWKVVFLCSVTALGAMGLGWLHAAFLIRDLTQHYLIGHHLAVPFKELTPVFASSYYTSSILNFLGHRPSALGYPFLFGTIAAFAEIHADAAAGRRQGGWAIIAVIFMAATALTMETGLVMLMASIAAFAAALIFLDLVDRRTVTGASMAFAFSSFVILGLSLFIAKHQGGILSTLSGDVSPDSFTLSFDGRLHFNPDGTSIALWDWRLYREFGLPLLLFPLSIVFSWRRRKTQPLLLLLCILAIANYMAPFVVHFGPRPYETNRLLFTGISVSGFLAALMIGETWLVSPGTFKRALARMLLASMLVSSTVYLVFRITFPTFRFEPSSLFAQMPTISAEQRSLYDWVNAHTTFADYFYMGVNLPELRPPLNRYPMDLQSHRALFMTYTGRMTIGPILWTLSFPAQKLLLFDSLEATCSAKDFRALQIRYLVIDSSERADWFGAHCSRQEWKTAYRDYAGLPWIEELRGQSAIAPR